MKTEDLYGKEGAKFRGILKFLKIKITDTFLVLENSAIVITLKLRKCAKEVEVISTPYFECVWSNPFISNYRVAKGLNILVKSRYEGRELKDWFVC